MTKDVSDTSLSIISSGCLLTWTLTFSSKPKWWFVVIFKCLISFLLLVLKVYKEFALATVADHIEEIMNYISFIYTSALERRGRGFKSCSRQILEFRLCSFISFIYRMLKKLWERWKVITKKDTIKEVLPYLRLLVE